MESRRNLILSLILVGLVIFVLARLFLNRSVPSPTGSNMPNTAAPAPTASNTWQKPQGQVLVPDANSSVPENVAKPTVVGPAGPNTSASFRSFDINVSGGAYAPSTLAVHKGDTVHINFKSLDGDYAFTQPEYGFNLSLPAGKKTAVEFGATLAGKFTFFCKACGGPGSGPVGYLIIAP